MAAREDRLLPVLDPGSGWCTSKSPYGPDCCSTLVCWKESLLPMVSSNRLSRNDLWSSWLLQLGWSKTICKMKIKIIIIKSILLTLTSFQRLNLSLFWLYRGIGGWELREDSALGILPVVVGESFDLARWWLSTLWRKDGAPGTTNEYAGGGGVDLLLCCAAAVIGHGLVANGRWQEGIWGVFFFAKWAHFTLNPYFQDNTRRWRCKLLKMLYYTKL